MPTTAFAVIFSVGSRTAAMGMTKSGTAPVRTAARLESTLCSAQVMRANGSATLKRPMTSRCPYIRGSVGSASRATATTIPSSSMPKKSRAATRVKGCRPASTPILMKR